ncbi:histidinol phosphate aminotransferase apoenzyme [Magnetococcus marinus MC-1]|uniref:threonine-phosphate decarboxylase n=1 Tax=Magnetococcus marinus (strain ATCC BAA-1437 / JCM 17883 / MC-1) TaxID=156889 RepID=A0LCC3_MAGMM|nr:threonine-phosphate decarboxylase CobD [Magnetococcus marinus]ABK45616.1 histidinol phosphate aminotransferase apoenzyme [Magnetococcus marinus MC-1]
MTTLQHGGRLYQAARQFGRPPAAWLDLSTAIHPQGWRPRQPIPDACWGRLPEDEDDLHAAAQGYYGTPHLVPVAGSQAAIQALPRLRAPARVGVVAPTYGEHALAWQGAGHGVQSLAAEQVESALAALDVLVVVNPNNPTGERFAVTQLQRWLHRLAGRGGWLVVDEAFMDATPQQSMLPQVGQPGLVVLRSLGKFFGLAGLRVGFCMGEQALLEAMQGLLGPWTLAHMARWAASQALQDRAWQAQTRAELPQQSDQLGQRLAQYGLPVWGGTALFQYVRHEQAQPIWRQFAQRGILLRHFEQPQALRVGLPGDAAQWQRFQTVLQEVMQEQARFRPGCAEGGAGAVG